MATSADLGGATKILSGKIDPDETPQSRHRKKIARKTAAEKKSVKVSSTWFEQRGTKIVKRMKMSNGNLKTEFVGLVCKKNAAMIDALKKQHTFKVV